MHHPRFKRSLWSRIALPALVLFLAACAPELSWAQTSPFMTGATALQTNARVAREYLVALPVELDIEGRVDLARNFAQELADRYRFAVDVAVHAPRDFPGSDPRNFHAHLLATTREVDPDGLGAKTALELNNASRRERGLGPSIGELLHVRERWASVTNEALREANVDARIDHRTLRAQGINREPQLWIPKIPYEVERRGFYSPVAERVRADHQAREAAHLKEDARQEDVRREEARREDARHGRDRQPEAGRAATSTPEAKPAPAAQPTASPPTLADMQRQARENWLRVRRELAQASPEIAKSRGREDDLSR